MYNLYGKCNSSLGLAFGETPNQCGKQYQVLGLLISRPTSDILK